MPVLALTAGGFAADVGHSLREAFYMLWETLWALVLGFTLSGAVQAFASREGMTRRLGDRRPASITRAALYGSASSSCSYAASAMARSLFARGADFVAALVFMVASTNLVVELGIVLAVLVGWQFLVAEYAGGVIMIALLAASGGLWFRGRALEEARSRARQAGGDAPEAVETADPERRPSRRIRTAAGWSDAAAYTMSDLTMLRREIVIGFGVAGFLTVLVPAHVWADVFVHGHGVWTSLENAAVGPLVAIASFVCSIGNVPLAAALWRGGTAFGGVVAFVFADLITLPLLLVYRKQYGGRMAVRILGLLWPVMSLAGFATEYLFRALGWVPAAHPGVVAGDRLHWDWTTWLDVAALAVLAALYVLYRLRDRLGAGAGYAKDPVCAMMVETAHAPASVVHDGQRYWFCCDACAGRFTADPQRYLEGSTPPGSHQEEAVPVMPPRPPPK